MVFVLATDNSRTHPAETWGKATAHSILPFDDTLAGERLAQAEAMRNRFTAILTRYHDTVQCIERDRLAIDAKHIHSAFGAGDMLDSVMEELFEATYDTPWFYLWQRGDVREIVRDIINSCVKTCQQHERQAFAHQHSENDDCRFFLNFFEGNP